MRRKIIASPRNAAEAVAVGVSLVLVCGAAVTTIGQTGFTLNTTQAAADVDTDEVPDSNAGGTSAGDTSTAASFSPGDLLVTVTSTGSATSQVRPPSTASGTTAAEAGEPNGAFTGTASTPAGPFISAPTPSSTSAPSAPSSSPTSTGSASPTGTGTGSASPTPRTPSGPSASPEAGGGGTGGAGSQVAPTPPATSDATPTSTDAGTDSTTLDIPQD